MADDRLYLRCNVCGKTLFLAKYWVGYYNHVVKTDNLEEWLDDHALCFAGGGQGHDVMNIEVVNERQRNELEAG